MPGGVSVRRRMRAERSTCVLIHAKSVACAVWDGQWQTWWNILSDASAGAKGTSNRKPVQPCVLEPDAVGREVPKTADSAV